MSDNPIKVTDKRMFTPDGQLREAYRHIEDTPSDSAAKDEARPAEASPPSAKAASPPPRTEVPDPVGAYAPTLFDLIALVAEPASIYLQKAQMVDGATAENLELASLHIDLLGVIKEKTAGNLTLQEQEVLDETLYQLRIAYVEIRGGGSG